jgi:hypothetical protein
MEYTGRPKHWISVKDIRTYFHLAESEGPAISGFLSKILQGCSSHAGTRLHGLKNSGTRRILIGLSGNTSSRSARSREAIKQQAQKIVGKSR